MKFGALDSVDDIDFSLPKDDKRTTALLSTLKKEGKPNVRIGCPVWGDKGYVGNMYPPKTKVKDYLLEYSKQFNCIEVNATRYGIPNQKTLDNWKNTVPEGFEFSFKMPQVITHRKNMNDAMAQAKLEQFLLALDSYGNKAGTTFMLLPNYFTIEKLPELEYFINNYPHDLPLSVEVRNTDFYTNQKVYDFLAERNISLCITDAPGRRDVVHTVLTSDTVFVRFVGHKLHDSDYTRIDQWVQKIVKWINEGVKNVYFYMHQPAPYKYLSGPLSAYMINELNKKIPELDLKPPIDYSGNYTEQGSLF